MEVIDTIIDALDSRFKQSVFPLLYKVEQFILSSANGEIDNTHSVIINDIDEFLTDDISVEREQAMLPDFLLAVNKEKNLGIKTITKIDTICELFNAQQIGKSIFSEYCKLIVLFLTIPVKTATAERSFSVLNRIKTYLRSTTFGSCYDSSYT